MSRENKKNKKSKGIAGMVLFLFWLIFILLAVIFYFYFSDSFLGFLKKDKSTTESVSSSEEAPHLLYEINAYPEITSLISTYLDAETSCSRDVLINLVTDASQFDDMSKYEEKADLIKGYENITCYTVSGYNENDMIVYVVSNLKFSEKSGISCKPLNINSYYVIKTEQGYLIDNNVTDPEVAAYISDIGKEKDIQDLYESVHYDIEACIQSDEVFARVYEIILQNSQ